jgi:NTP pyrophosphatase (non-canonical NTP hydrolase)
MKNTFKVGEDVSLEILKQDIKWGADRHKDPFTWLGILIEEVGEYSTASLENKFNGKDTSEMYDEIIQVAAVALQIANDILLEKERNSGWQKHLE